VKSEVSASYLSWGPVCPRQEAWRGKGCGKLPLTSRCRVPHTSAPCPELLPLSGCGGNMGEEESWQEVLMAVLFIKLVGC